MADSYYPRYLGLTRLVFDKTLFVDDGKLTPAPRHLLSRAKKANH